MYINNNEETTDDVDLILTVDDAVMPQRTYDTAYYSHGEILNQIREFENSLDDQHEVAIKLSSFGESVTMSVTKIGYLNPNMLVFQGYVKDKTATLIQHMSQLNFLLIAVPKENQNAPPRRIIGFTADRAKQPTKDQ